MAVLTLSDRLRIREVDRTLLGALRNTFEPVDEIRGALLMGSRSRSVTHARSNIDLQLIVDRLNLDVTSQIIQARDRLAADLGVAISINVHTVSDAQPSLGKHGLFVHRNRAELFVYQAKYTSVPVFGRNIFAEFDDPRPTSVRREAIRTVASFAYAMRKYLFEPGLAPHGPKEFVRTPLIALEYIAAFYGYLSMGFRDALAYLMAEPRQAGLSRDEENFLEICGYRKEVSDYHDVDRAFALRALTFLENVHGRMVTDFRRYGVGDVRWDGTRRCVSGDLHLPQAATMTILRSGSTICLLRRPPDDYLYPDQWTIPGGYLQADETPLDGARRETWEETGTFATLTSMFDGLPAVSDRLAAWVFEANVSEQAPRLTEHTAHAFVPLDDVSSLPLTPEARQILEHYTTTINTTSSRNATPG